MSDDTLRKVLETEIHWMRSQAAWLGAFAGGIADHSGNASTWLLRQASQWAEEAGAAERRMQKILKQSEVD